MMSSLFQGNAGLYLTGIEYFEIIVLLSNNAMVVSKML